MTDKDYRSQAWQVEHKARRRAHLRKWYYRRRKAINISFSLPSGKEKDVADFALDTARWNPF